MKTKTRIIEKEEEMGHDDENSTGARIAVLRNEVKHVNDTVSRMESKMDSFISNSVTQAQLAAAQLAANTAHKELTDDLAALRKDVEELQSWRNSIANKIAVAALIILVLMVLANYGIDKYLRA